MTDHYSLQTEYGAADELYKAIITLDKKRIKELKANGAALTENARNVLENGPGRRYKGDPAFDFWFALIREIKTMPLGEFSEIAGLLRAETGKPLYYSEAFWLWGNKRAFEPRFFELTLENFDQKRMSKKRTMQRIIDTDALGCLPVCEKHGWLKMPKTRDELIGYANEKGKTEAVAWLLDFKNRTADLAAERQRAEKKAERELNADPNSVTELKKIWRTKKLEDGTLEITCYNGRQTEVIVPDKIGKYMVTSIGNRAFTGDRYAANRTPEEICEFRKNNITKIILPETINNIGSGAFLFCEALKEVNIPSGVTIINSNTFTNTAIDTIELPETVERLADYAFSAAHFKKIKLPQNLAEIGKGALQHCDFERIEIPPKIKVINPEMFWNCKCLKEVVLPEGLEEIKMRAFWLCPSLEKINLPASITKIENFKRGGKITSPFADNLKLTAVVDKGSYAEKYCEENKIIYKYTEE